MSDISENSVSNAKHLQNGWQWWLQYQVHSYVFVYRGEVYFPGDVYTTVAQAFLARKRYVDWAASGTYGPIV